jgi:hypothetical protein
MNPGGLNERIADVFRLFWDHGYKSMAIGERVTEVHDVETCHRNQPNRTREAKRGLGR